MSLKVAYKQSDKTRKQRIEELTNALYERLSYKWARKPKAPESVNKFLKSIIEKK